MRLNSPLTKLAALLWLAALGCLGCTTPEPYDYTAFRAHMPTSILVLPPLDETLEVGASYAYLSTVTRPLAEAGYYVFPVALVDQYMRENGLPTPVEMHAVPLSKLTEAFDPDAVLYLQLSEWGTSYQVLQSVTEVTVQAKLVDVASGQPIWGGTFRATQGSGSGGGGLVGALTGALVNQIATSISDPSREVAEIANQGLFANSRSGLLRGPLHPEYGLKD